MNAYQRRVIRQTMLWVNGKSEHNKTDDECCPDFSCCRPDMYEKDEKARVKYFTDLMRRYSKPPLKRKEAPGHNKRLQVSKR